MRARLFTPVAVLFALTACGPKDSDGDGILDDDEVTAGTDPQKADSDDDGLSDKAEQDAGTDPLAADSDQDGLTDGDEVDTYHSDPMSTDSDGDGYLDGDEVTEGKDPADASSVIYQGGWPYYAHKGDIDNPGWSGDADVGDVLPRWQWVDQYGDTVDIYDFAYQGKPIVIDLSALWCGWCKEVAGWLEYDDGNYFDNYPEYDPVREAVKNGDVYWITIIGQDNSGNDAEPADAKTWYKEFPNDTIPVVAGDQNKLVPYLDVSGWPTMILVNEDMTISYVNPADYTKTWDAVNDYLDKKQ